MNFGKTHRNLPFFVFYADKEKLKKVFNLQITKILRNMEPYEIKIILIKKRVLLDIRELSVKRDTENIPNTMDKLALTFQLLCFTENHCLRLLMLTANAYSPRTSQ